MHFNSAVDLRFPGPSALGPMSPLAATTGQLQQGQRSAYIPDAAGGLDTASSDTPLNSEDESNSSSDGGSSVGNAASVSTFQQLEALLANGASAKTRDQEEAVSQSEMPTRPSSPVLAIGEAGGEDLGDVAAPEMASQPLGAFGETVQATITRRSSALQESPTPTPKSASKHERSRVQRATDARVHAMRQTLRQGVGDFLPAKAVAAGHLARAAVQAAPMTAVMDAARRRRNAIVGLHAHLDLLEAPAALPAPSKVAAALMRAQMHLPSTQQVAPIRSAVLSQVLLPLLEELVLAAAEAGEGSQDLISALQYSKTVVTSVYVQPLVGRINSKRDVAMLDADAVRTVLAGMLASYACRYLLHSCPTSTQQKICTAYSSTLFMHRCVLLGVLSVAGLAAARLAAVGIAAVAEGTFGVALPAIMQTTPHDDTTAASVPTLQVLLALGGHNGERLQQARFLVRAVAEAAELQDTLQNTHKSQNPEALLRYMAMEKKNSAAALSGMQRSAEERTALRLQLLLQLLPSDEDGAATA